MKPFSLLLSLVLLNCTVFAQKPDLLLYTNLGGGGGNIFYYKIGATAIIKHKHSFTLLLGEYLRDAKELPVDYIPASNILGTDILNTDLQTIDILYGRLVTTTHTQLIRLNFKAGLSIGRYTYPGNFVPYVDTSEPHGFTFFDLSDGANYTHEDIIRPMFGIVLNPVLELPLTVPFGLSAGVYANINNRSSFIKLEINILLGKVRNKIQNNKPANNF